MNKSVLVLNIDYYLDPNGNLVFTEKYHLERGYCCQSGCFHCPYNYANIVDPNIPAELSSPWTEGTPQNFDEEE